MIKSLLLVLFALITGNFLFAQQNTLQIKGTGANVHLEHVVSPKESFYSIGRMYNVSPKELALYNHLKAGSGLEIGQNLKIPLNKNNFLQEGKAAANEALIPVYHTVDGGETLYRLGVNYNKVPLGLLKKWNHLTSDAVKVGVPMIVGFLKVDPSLSTLAIENKVSSGIAVEQPQALPVAEPAPQKKEVPQQAVAIPEKNEPIVQQKNTPAATSDSESGGYFKNLFDQQNQQKVLIDKSGSAGVFKSTSGWQDTKYYCFNNDAAPGTIVKVTNTSTNKFVYAKVLDAIPDIKQNAGLIIVISNSAAQELGAGDNKFDCVLSFGK